MKDTAPHAGFHVKRRRERNEGGSDEAAEMDWVGNEGGQMKKRHTPPKASAYWKKYREERGRWQGMLRRA